MKNLTENLPVGFIVLLGIYIDLNLLNDEFGNNKKQTKKTTKKTKKQQL